MGHARGRHRREPQVDGRTILNRNVVDDHPFDTPLSGGLRFVAENIAWVAGPWAVASVSVWLVVPAVVIVIGVPSVFSTPGDKKLIVVPTPGPLRLLIELALYGVAVGAMWIRWPGGIAVAASAVVAAAVITGIPRMRWLLSGAPVDSTQDPPGS
ncbi:MAG: hypothetical protein QF477_16125 [SAR202 cluster bacterium]|nr:hypothetical protein [SAR202 cluster bacterium]MDP6665565.1 hypothetical protein [SAR202 cluster bacterium]MDP6799206.1 hypothetical protein [SAR202 cluster bacterium]